MKKNLRHLQKIFRLEIFTMEGLGKLNFFFWNFVTLFTTWYDYIICIYSYSTEISSNSAE